MLVFKVSWSIAGCSSQTIKPLSVCGAELQLRSTLNMGNAGEEKCFIKWAQEYLACTARHLGF